MNIFTGARMFGALITMALALWAIGREVHRAEWRHRFQVVMGTRSEKTGLNLDLWRKYLRRIETYQSLLDRPYNSKTTFMHVIGLFLLFFVVTLLLHYFVVVGLVISGSLSLFLYERFWANRSRKRKEALAGSWLYEAVPIAVHVMTATKRLDEAIHRMHQMVHNPYLKQKLARLTDIVDAPQFATPEDVFLFWANDMGIRDIEYFALATKEAKKYNVPIERLWIDMADLLGKDLEFKRGIRAQTSHHRTGGYTFYAMLAGSFLIAYPFVSKFISEGTKILFWAVLGIMTLGLYLIMRESGRIDA